MVSRVTSLALLTLALLAGCAGPADSPDEQIRQMLREIERASREHDLKAMKSFVSESYADPHGRTKRDLSGIITYQYFRRRSVYLVTKIESLALETPASATLTVLAAMAARPIPELETLRRIQADLYRFDLEVADEGGGAWRVTSAAWRPARLDDFF